MRRKDWSGVAAWVGLALLAPEVGRAELTVASVSARSEHSGQVPLTDEEGLTVQPATRVASDQALVPPQPTPRLEPQAVEKRRFEPSGAEHALVPADSFDMGCVSQDGQCQGDEKPNHRVMLSRDFWMMVTEATVGEYRRFAQATGHVMPLSPDFPQGDDHPVVNVSWDEAAAYCRWAGDRLPSEAEWEYAARGGRQGSVYPWGDDLSREEANSRGTGGRDRWRRTSPVGSFAANGYGLYDMTGNVWEWCADSYDESYYGSSPPSDPPGPPSGPGRVLRGGSWNLAPRFLRLSYRNWVVPTVRVDFFGLRCVRDVALP